MTDDDIAFLLQEDADGVDISSAEGDGSQLFGDSSQSTIMASLSEAAAPPQAKPRSDIRIVTLRADSVLVEFLTKRLEETPFRCAMPRTCMRCGTRAHLQAHIVIFRPHTRNAPSGEMGQSVGELVVTDEDLQRLEGKALLDRLPEVKNVPPPGNLPMPFWLCDMCPEGGVVVGQIKVDARTRKRACRRLIRNPNRAEEFLRAAGGDRVVGLDKLHELNAAGRENPWDLVPMVIRHRIEQWFRPQEDEQFLGYVPDRDRSRTEDGMAGLLISSRRMIYHTHLRHRESSAEESVELLLAMSRDKGQLRIHTPHWVVKRMTVDKEGVRRLRRALTMGKYRATWR